MTKKKNKTDIKFAILMSAITTFFVTFAIVSINLGYQENFIFVWFRSWLIAFILVGLSILFVAPHIDQFLKKYE
jgi:Protein of unknown function (DUF2798)